MDRSLRLRRTVASLAVLVAASASAAGPDGRFITQSGNLEVEVAPCGNALCGTVTKVIADKSMSHPGEEMRPADGRPALGLRILSDFTPGSTATPASTWRGQIYNRENGKTYDCIMSVNDAGNLTLRAYVLLPLFGKTQVWQRVAQEPSSGAR